jgi:hypothetical protein
LENLHDTPVILLICVREYKRTKKPTGLNPQEQAQ